ncbi:MAG: hypothetical protein OIF56_07050 [Cohaesibacter sp.]|nr:hypothetical protein [Cohaesibacter sp.]MCV6600956.1 hypothetical protein [Cohaesibacter sp.]
MRSLICWDKGATFFEKIACKALENDLKDLPNHIVMDLIMSALVTLKRVEVEKNNLKEAEDKYVEMDANDSVPAFMMDALKSARRDRMKSAYKNSVGAPA